MKSKGIYKAMQDKVSVSTKPPGFVDVEIPRSEYFFHTKSKTSIIPVK